MFNAPGNKIKISTFDGAVMARVKDFVSLEFKITSYTFERPVRCVPSKRYAHRRFTDAEYQTSVMDMAILSIVDVLRGAIELE